MNYFGFGMSPSMFPANEWKERCVIVPRIVDPSLMKGYFEKAKSCLNPSHKATIEAAKVRYSLNLVIPEKAPIVKLEPGDTLWVMGVTGLPRLEGRHEYTDEEIKKAEFVFYEFDIVPVSQLLVKGN